MDHFSYDRPGAEPFPIARGETVCVAVVGIRVRRFCRKSDRALRAGAGIPIVIMMGTLSETGEAGRAPQVSHRKIDHFLSERHQRFTPLQRLLRHAADQETWTAGLRALLPQPLRSQCHVYDVRGGSLFVSCRSAAAATRLRFLVPELLTSLRTLQDFSRVHEIRIKVNPES